MAKNYHLGKGINVGFRLVGGQDANIQGLEYSDNLLDFFDRDVQDNIKFLSTNFKEQYVQAMKTPEWNSFIEQIRKEYGDEEGEFNLTPEIQRKMDKKRLKIMGEECAKALDAHILQRKAFWKPKVEYIEEIMGAAKNGNEQNKPLPQKSADGTLKGEFLTHNFRFSEDVDEYYSRQDLGILASEWFGQGEFMSEGFMCSFFEKKDELKPSKDTFLEKDDIGFPIKAKHPNFTLILDASNPDLKKLLENDFFEYARNKENLENLSKLSEQQRSLFEAIEQDSQKSTVVAKAHPDWVAVPGGVPSRFIIGLVAHNLDISSPDFAMCQEAADIFEAPLLNSALDVVYSPSKKLSKADLKPKEQDFSV